MSEERIKLTLDLGDSKKSAEDLKRELESLGVKVRDVGKASDDASRATDKAAASTGDLGRSVLEGSRILQDFAQGGLGGVINNLEGFVRAAGFGAGAAGAATGLGVAFLALGPPLKNFITAMIQGANEVPKHSDALDRLNAELKVSKDRMEALQGQQKLTNAELAEYESLVKRTNELEREANALRKQRADTEAARSQKTDDQSALARDFGKISGGADYDRIVNEVAASSPQGQYNALREQYDQLAGRQKLTAAEGQQMREMALRLNEMARAGGIVGNGGAEAARRQAEELVNRARGGDLGAFDQVVAGTRGATRDQVVATDPRLAGRRQFIEKQAAEAISDAIGDAVNPIITGLRQANEKAKADRKMVDELNKAGAEGEQLYNQQQAENRRADQERAAGVREQQANMSDAYKATLAQRDASDTADLRRIAQNEFGSDLTDSQAADALKQARAMTEQGFAPGIAARQAILGAMQELAGVVQKGIEATNFQAAEVAAMRAYIQNLRQMQQVAPSILNMGRQDGAQGDAADLWAAINNLAAQQRDERTRDAWTRPAVKTPMRRVWGGAPGDAAISGAEFDTFAAAARENIDLIHERVGRLMRQEPTTPSLLTWGSGW